ncbi:riboflavin synthase [bacterium]|nr:riboflavin synthase [bacterium]
MFTGLIRDVGRISSWERRSDSVLFSIETKLSLSTLSLGASIACNGACLTVIKSESSTQPGKSTFFVEAGPQTLKLTQFGLPKYVGNNSLINLEPALRVGDALGGHLVSGHVDTLATVVSNIPTGDGFWKLRVKFSSEFVSYVVKKGSIAVSGVSLTIADCSHDEADPWLEIMLIPHTLSETNLQLLSAGALVELEFDSQAKLVADMLKIMVPRHLKTLTKSH